MSTLLIGSSCTDIPSPDVRQLHMTTWNHENESMEDLATRLQLTFRELTHFWSNNYTFDSTPSCLTGIVPMVVEVPEHVAALMDVCTVSMRVISKLEPEFPEWTADVYRVMMDLLSRAQQREDASASLPSSSVTSSAQGSVRPSKRSDHVAPGPAPRALTPNNVCLHSVLNSIDLNHLIDRQPMLRTRRVYSKIVVDWCLIFKRLTADTFRVYLLNGNTNNRYATASTTELHFPEGCDLSTAGGPVDVYTPLTMHSSEKVCWDDGVLDHPLYIQSSGQDSFPQPMFVENMFGGDYLQAGWYSQHITQERSLQLYVSLRCPTLVYVYNETLQAVV